MSPTIPEASSWIGRIPPSLIFPTSGRGRSSGHRCLAKEENIAALAVVKGRRACLWSLHRIEELQLEKRSGNGSTREAKRSVRWRSAGLCRPEAAKALSHALSSQDAIIRLALWRWVESETARRRALAESGKGELDPFEARCHLCAL